MTKSERASLIAAIDDLERNPCCWEDAMSKLYSLAGLSYIDHRKIKGTSVDIWKVMTGRLADEYALRQSELNRRKVK